MIKKIVILLFVLLVVLYQVTINYVDSKIQITTKNDIYNSCHKIWSARGVYEEYANQNSIGSFKKAFSRGSVGAEVDLYYDVKSNRFIISHDRPKKDKNGELIYTKKDGVILTLEKLLQDVGENHYFWLDYKNLNRITLKETEIAIERLLAITAGNLVRDRLYIEGSDPWLLSVYTDAGFKTILGIHPPYESNWLSSLTNNVYKMAYYFNNISAIAMSYGLLNDPAYGAQTQAIFNHVPVFLFHVPDNKQLITKLKKQSNVRVMLIGRDISLDRASMNDCPDTSQ